MLHLVRLFVPVRLAIGGYEVPLKVTAAVGLLSLAVSAGFLLIEARRERLKRASKDGRDP